MKKTIVLFVLMVLSIFLIVSCKDKDEINNKDDKEIIMEDLYFFRAYSGEAFLDNHIIKIKPVSKTVTHVCADPLCSHDNSDCPFYKKQVWYPSGNYIFFTRGTIDGLLGDADIIRPTQKKTSS